MTLSTAPVPRRWRPSAAIRASVAWHGLAAVATVAQPSAWPLALGAVAANHLALTAAGLWPRSRWLGPTLVRLPEPAARDGAVAMTIDDGPDPEVTPRLLDLLAQAGARATFFCIGEQVRRHPALARRIVAEGHAVENHSMRHPIGFSWQGPRGFRREIGDAQALVADTVGVAPCWFRAPAGLRNPLLEPVLCEFGLHLAAWTRRGFDTRERDPRRVRDRLMRGAAAGDVLLLHDGHAARDAAGVPVAVTVLPQVLEAWRARGWTPVRLRDLAMSAHAPAGAAESRR